MLTDDFFREYNPINDAWAYKGKDDNIYEKKFCANCCENKDNLMRCSHCMLENYCNQECQREAYKRHKKECKSVYECRKKVAALEIAMRGGEIASWDDNQYKFAGKRVDFFDEKYLGDWWGYLDPRDYCRAVSLLSNNIKDIAWDYEVISIWKECANLKLELLRYNLRDDQGNRFELPSVLLYLNRDDDCFKFIKWWALRLEERYVRKDYNRPNDTNKLWQKGEFVYNEVEGNRYDDVYPMFDDNGEQILELDQEIRVELSGVLALVIIKMRICAHLECSMFSLKEDPAADTTVLRTRHATQMKLLDKYLKMTHKMNKYILHIFASDENVTFMRAQGPPHYSTKNSPEEAFRHMDLYIRHIARIPCGLVYCETFLEKIGEMTNSPDLHYNVHYQYQRR